MITKPSILQKKSAEAETPPVLTIKFLMLFQASLKILLSFKLILLTIALLLFLVAKLSCVKTAFTLLIYQSKRLL